MALATVAQVTARLEEEPTERMLVMIAEYLEEASDAAKYHGKEWSEIDVPNAVARIVASAVARFMRNPDRYSQSRAGDETVGFQDSGVDWFTDLEIERLARLAAPARLKAFGTVRVSAFKASAPDLNLYSVPTYGPGKDFPLFGVGEVDE